MYEPFELPVLHNGEELLFPAQLLQHGYIHRFQVTVYGKPVLFERDDEGKYRALLDPETAQKTNLNKNLLKAIAETLFSLSN